jgi:hypothetical protein
MRVDRPSGVGFNEYSLREKADSTDWMMREIVGKIDPDAVRITIGMRVSGMGAASLADPEFEIVETQP